MRADVVADQSEMRAAAATSPPSHVVSGVSASQRRDEARRSWPRSSRSSMDRFIDGIELIAAIFVGIVAADIFISVLLRYFFSDPDPRHATISAGCCSAS